MQTFYSHFDEQTESGGAPMRPLSKEFNPMKYETEVLEFWRKNHTYRKVREMLKGREKFYFLDGPPYPSSKEPHPGTCWNKFIKDSVVRYWRSRGYDVRDQPGWDTHGLPIEVATEKELGFSTKKDIESYGIDKFVEKCKELAMENLREMTTAFETLGVSLDWDNPYITFERSYISSAWWGLKRIWESGRLKKGLVVVHWCPRCETVLADYEVSEYKDLQDPSIYVRFPTDKGDIVIWTTTPWTLPANVAVMVHPDEDYVRVEAGGNVLIMAEKRLEKVMDEIGIKDYKIIEKMKGSQLEGLRYRNPLEKRVPVQREVDHKVILSREYVTMEEGTGCVHSAPGHGKEDFEAAHVRYGMPVLSPVDERGIFTEEAGEYKGLSVREANSRIIEDLRADGFLLYSGRIVHKYPVCWRCKTPLILRATEQWYVKLSDLRDELIREVDRVRWVPQWGGERRFKNWLMNLEDWIISRQRYWGTPLPIWICNKCGKTEVISGEKELVEKAGVKPKDLHKPWVDEIKWRCSCGGEMRRVPDVADVWYDSGISFFASLSYPEKDDYERLKPVDFVVEGHDQFRGWFFSLLRVGYLIFGSAPYKTVLSHGFMLDERGREMHKSLGNYVPVDEIKNRFGADAFRLFVLSKVTWSDLRFNMREMENTLKKLQVIWNVFVFISEYAMLEGEGEMSQEDRWILSRLNSTIKDIRNAMEEYRIHDAVNSLLNFLVEDLSHLYLRYARKRVRRNPSVSRILREIASKILPVLSIFAPFTAERIYQESFREEGMPESVNMLPWPEHDEKAIDKRLEDLMNSARAVIAAANSIRARRKMRIRQPLPELRVSEELREVVATFPDLIMEEVNVKRISVGRAEWDEENVQGGKVYLNTEVDTELAREGMRRELIRRIQQMRKEMGLRRGVEKVKVYIKGVDNLLDEEAMEEVDAVSVEIGEGRGYRKDWEMFGKKVTIWLERSE